MDTLSPWMLVAFAALGAAWVQLLVAGHRDLGVVSLALGGAMSTLAGPDDYGVLAMVLVAMSGLLGLAWWRGARAGVGRPGLAGLGLCVALPSGLAPLWAPWLGVDPLRVGAVGLGACLLVALAGGAMALERPGPRRRRPRWYGTVPIR